MHGYFVLAGNGEVPVIYQVERIRQGKSFATRSVQAKQQGQCIFTTIISFARESSGGRRVIEHAVPMPDVPLPDGHPTDTQSWGGVVGPLETVDVQPSATGRRPLVFWVWQSCSYSAFWCLSNTIQQKGRR